MILSIVIPVYNVEKYIVKCLDSIYSQGADGSLFQVIIVNDGTKDNSIELIKDVIDQNENCTLINQQNQGLSGARNTGLKAAQGKYVWFVDSDDEIVSGSLTPILDLLKDREEDVVAYNVFIKDEATGNKRKGSPFAVRYTDDFYERSYPGEQALGQFHKGLVQRYMLNREFMYENKLEFLPGIWYEDDQLLVRLFCFNKNIYVSSICSYCYLQRHSGSIMSTVSIRSVNDSYKIIDSWNAFLQSNEIMGLSKRWVFYNIYRYYDYILSLQGAGIKEYHGVMKGKMFVTKIQTIKYAFRSGKFISNRTILRTIAQSLFPKLILK